jgi:tetratricopeptide (TPR) repeat protein
MTQSDPELPDDWRDRENGHELLIAALIRAYRRRDEEQLGELVEAGGELAAYGAFFAAHAVASIGVSYLLAVPLESVVMEYQASDPSRERARRIRAESPAGELTAKVLGVAAFIARREGRTDDALVLYQDAVAAADGSGDQLRSARLHQSLGALYHETGNTVLAREVTEVALARFQRLGDGIGVAGTELNLVEYAAEEERPEEALERLRRIEAQVREVQDPRLWGSWVARSAIFDILNGEIRQGRQKLHQALRMAERHGDTALQVVTLGHLAKSARDDGRGARAITYAQRALSVAEASGDRALISSTAHELAIDYAEREEFPQAIAMLERAGEAATGLARTRVRADLGAVVLSRVLVARGDGSATDAEDAAWLHEAEDLLLEAVSDLLREDDEDWAERALGNLRIVWIASGQAEHGAQHLRNFAAHSLGGSQAFAGECYRLSGLLAMDSGADSSEVLDRLRVAARLLSPDEGRRASALLEFAGIAEHSYRAYDVAMALYDDALDELVPSDEPTVYGNALNDSALVALALDNDDLAIERLGAAAHIARERSDRVLGSLVELNLGEILAKADQPLQARPHFERAAAQAEAFGDDERAALALASLANTFVSDEETTDFTFARSVVARAGVLAERSGDPNARARAVSARASLAFADNDLDAAYDLWSRARDITEPARRSIYEGFLLQTLARKGDGPKFNRQMNRFARASQRNHSQLVFAEQLWSPANVWLRQGDVRRAANALATSVILAVDGRAVGTGEKKVLIEDQVAVRIEEHIAVVRITSYVGHMLTMDVIPADLRAQLKPALMKALSDRGVSQDDAVEFINAVERVVLEVD